MKLSHGQMTDDDRRMLAYPAARLRSVVFPLDRSKPLPDSFRKLLVPEVLELAEQKGVIGIPLVELDTPIPETADDYEEHAAVHHPATGEVVFAMEVRFTAPAKATVGFTVAPLDAVTCSWILAIAAVGLLLVRGAGATERDDKFITPCADTRRLAREAALLGAKALRGPSGPPN